MGSRDAATTRAGDEHGLPMVLVEDLVSYHQALRSALPHRFRLRVAGAVDRPEEAGQIARTAGAAVALVNVDLPDAGGIAALAAIRQASPSTGQVAMTRTTDPALRGRCLEEGAAAVVPRTLELAELCGILLQVAEGGHALPVDELSEWLRAASAERSDHWRARAIAEQLTAREQQVLVLLAQGFDTRSIARALEVTRETAATHVRNVLTKLGVGTRLTAVLEAQRLGLVDPPTTRRLPESG